MHFFSNGALTTAAEAFAGGPPPPPRRTSSEPTAAQELAARVLQALEASRGACVRIFVSGAVTHVGKTSVCLALLQALREAGVEASGLAYIKPATQCEAPDLLARWCATEGIEHVAGESAPLVFYQGFTRSFLAGEQGTSDQWLAKIAGKVNALAEGRTVLVVDGVGFPSVGSIVGVDNADVAKAARAPVLLVCKCGVGGAIDSFNLNRTYFFSKGVPVLGAIFNLGDNDGFYSVSKCAESLTLWFRQRLELRERCYGAVPVVAELDGLRERISETDAKAVTELARVNARHFAQYVDFAAVLADAAADPWCRAPGRAARASDGEPPAKLQALGQAAPAGGPGAAAIGKDEAAFKPMPRAAVAAGAKKQGARGGG